MNFQYSAHGFMHRALMAIACTWLVVTFASLSMRSLEHMDGQLIATIMVVAIAVAIISGLSCAVLIRKRPVLMVIASQLAGFALLATIGRL